MSSILDTSSLYSTYGQSISNASATTLEGTLNSVGDSTSDDELMEVCKDFEAYFVQKIIEQAKSTIAGEDEDEQGEYMQYFGDMLNEQYADAIAESGSTGLAQQLYESMKTNYSL
jgi:flagellar protein FlgJ